MKPDRPLILSILFLAAGLWLVFGYAHGIAGLSAAWPVANSTIHVDVNTSGLGALSGIALLGIGLLLLVWSLLAAIVSQLMLLAGGSYKGPAKLLDYRSSEEYQPADIEEEDAPVSRSANRRGSFSTLGLHSAGPSEETRASTRIAAEEEVQPSGTNSLPAGIRP